MSGKSEASVEAPDRIFNAESNDQIVNETLTWYLASSRQGNACAKTRAEVSGGGRKPWRQKGTGRARIGDNRAPHWRKGGVAFPPKPRDYSFALPQKIKKAAIRVVLSGKARDGKIKVIENISLASAKTKEMAKLLNGLGVAGSVLLVLSKKDENISRAASNLRGVTVLEGRALNVYDILKSDELVMVKDAIGILEETYK